MGFATKYLEKHQFLKLKISEAPMGLLKYIVIIPAYCEPEIFATLNSLSECTLIKEQIEIFILVNYSESCSDEIKNQNIELYESLVKWTAKKNRQLTFIPFLAKNLPNKHAGAGLARKILMDAACSRFNSVNNDAGLIISLDADTLVPSNYFTELNNQANQQPETDCYILNFAHPIYDTVFSKNIYNAIVLYELHLRYYKQILKLIDYPFYHYTIGSCFVVKAKTYVKVGGMSRRKAGEDFYFLHKIFPVAKTFFLRKVKLIPSPRPSWRVPFGTGPAIRQISNEFMGTYKTYNPKSFYDLQSFLNLIPDFAKLSIDKSLIIINKLPDSIRKFIDMNNIISKIKEVKNNSASEDAFIKRFYNWFDAFVVLKYLNFARDNFFDSINILDAVKEFIDVKEDDSFKLLELMRKIDD